MDIILSNKILKSLWGKTPVNIQSLKKNRDTTETQPIQLVNS